MAGITRVGARAPASRVSAARIGFGAPPDTLTGPGSGGWLSTAPLHEEAPSLAPAITMDLRIRPANLPSDRADPRSISGGIEQALRSEAVSGVPTGPFSVRAVTWPGRRTPGPVAHDGIQLADTADRVSPASIRADLQAS